MVLLCWFVDIYGAPEIYKDEIFDRTVDAYSFGIILYEVHFFFFIYFLSIGMLSSMIKIHQLELAYYILYWYIMQAYYINRLFNSRK